MITYILDLMLIATGLILRDLHIQYFNIIDYSRLFHI